MTRDYLIRMAHECGIHLGGPPLEPGLERFADLVAETEREALLKAKDIAESFHRVAVSERNYERAARDVLTARHEILLRLAREARDYLSCIPESAAGGDDAAVRLAEALSNYLQDS